MRIFLYAADQCPLLKSGSDSILQVLIKRWQRKQRTCVFPKESRHTREIGDFSSYDHDIHGSWILQCDGGSRAAVCGHVAGLRIVAMVEAGAGARTVRRHCATQHLLPPSCLRLPFPGFQQPLQPEPSHPCCGFPLQSRSSLLSPGS